ncbi:hypothetical protein RhiirA5_402971 [Rhizophagus irregularis]|uniref:Uncharacterized protein n=1 Tax=Rhizophagus irregularis TaxID=588596 RepID=A0A2N0P2N6_9GLOM|nr:hypothetical protein RhiirA5_402971 [Rhizophagus irregularis]
MSSYKTDTLTGQPILYLQDHKKALWERFSEQYPNGMRRTSFMTKLQGGRFVYQENLGGLCSTCNDNGYLVFGDINILIAANISDELIRIAQAIKWYVKLGFEVKSGDDIENAIKDIAGTRVEIQVTFGIANFRFH